MTIDDPTAALLKALKVEDTDAFKINTMEALGILVLMNHWLRGVFTWLHFTGAVKYDTAEGQANYERLNRNIELYEELLWKIVPPRAMLQQLRLWREQGYLDADFLRLLEADEFGRFDLEDTKICDIVKRGNALDGKREIPLQ